VGNKTVSAELSRKANNSSNSCSCPSSGDGVRAASVVVKLIEITTQPCGGRLAHPSREVHKKFHSTLSNRVSHQSAHPTFWSRIGATGVVKLINKLTQTFGSRNKVRVTLEALHPHKTAKPRPKQGIPALWRPLVCGSVFELFSIP